MTQPVRRPSARIVIVNWRQAELTIRAARSIREQLGDGDVLVVVDNASGDGSVERLRREGLTVVKSSENLGFGAGVNLGAQGMVEDVLVLLNNDAVAEPDFLEALLRTLSDPPSETAPAAATARRWPVPDGGRTAAAPCPRCLAACAAGAASPVPGPAGVMGCSCNLLQRIWPP